MFYLVGLGNPGEEYKLSRHNAGRIVLADFLKSAGINLEFSKKLNALTGERYLDKEKIQIIFPETFMNKSGLSLRPLVGKIVKKKVYPVGKRSLPYGAENLILVHDDVDLPIGKIKICFGKGSGGHKGVESVIRNIKTKNFIRIRIGVSPTTSSGKIKKPNSENIVDFIITGFKESEREILKKLSKKISLAVGTIISEGLEKAMNMYN